METKGERYISELVLYWEGRIQLFQQKKSLDFIAKIIQTIIHPGDQLSTSSLLQKCTISLPPRLKSGSITWFIIQHLSPSAISSERIRGPIKQVLANSKMSIQNQHLTVGTMQCMTQLGRVPCLMHFIVINVFKAYSCQLLCLKPFFYFDWMRPWFTACLVDFLSYISGSESVAKIL